MNACDPNARGSHLHAAADRDDGRHVRLHERGALLRGEGLEGAVGRATDFTRQCVRRTMGLPTPVNYGVDLEPLLPLLWEGAGKGEP